MRNRLRLINHDNIRQQYANTHPILEFVQLYNLRLFSSKSESHYIGRPDYFKYAEFWSAKVLVMRMIK